MHRNIDIRRGVGISAKETRRSDADNGERDIVDVDGLTKRLVRAAETSLTQRETDGRDGRSSSAVIIGRNQASSRGPNRKTAEVIARHILYLGELGVAADSQIESACALVSEDGREYGVIAAEEVEGGIGEKTANKSSVGIPIAIVMAVGAVHLGLGRMPPQQHQRLRIGDGQRAQEDGIHKAEYGGVGSNAESEGQNRKRTEALVGQHRAQSIAGILEELF